MIFLKSFNNKKRKVDIANDVEFDMQEHNDVNYDEYNYVATYNHWLSLEEQKNKAKEIEKATKKFE